MRPTYYSIIKVHQAFACAPVRQRGVLLTFFESQEHTALANHDIIIFVKTHGDPACRRVIKLTLAV